MARKLHLNHKNITKIRKENLTKFWFPDRSAFVTKFWPPCLRLGTGLIALATWRCVYVRLRNECNTDAAAWREATSWHMGSDSSVGKATSYRLDGPGIDPGGDEIFRTRPVRTWGHPASCTMGTDSFPGVKRPVRDTDLSPLLLQWSWKGRAITLLPL